MINDYENRKTVEDINISRTKCNEYDPDSDLSDLADIFGFSRLRLKTFESYFQEMRTKNMCFLYHKN